jgi:hypothetical protein
MQNDDLNMKISRKKDKDMLRAHQQNVDYDDDYEEGSITGYAVHEPANVSDNY